VTNDAPALYLTDEQVADRLGIGVDKWRENARVLEPQGLPKRDPLFCRRRYWPAVRAFLDRRNGLATASPVKSSWEEKVNGKRTRIEASPAR
jgi:hypothetical protein